MGGWILLVALLTVGYRYMGIHAIDRVSVGLASGIKHTSALFVTLIGGELFHEKQLARRVVACVIMIAGAFLLLL